MNKTSDRWRVGIGSAAPSADRRRTQVGAPASSTSARFGASEEGAWPSTEILNSSLIVLVGLVVMTALIFVFDWAAVPRGDFVFK